MSDVAELPSNHVMPPRCTEVVQLMANGKSAKVIAREMDLSLWTVQTYIARAKAFFGVKKETELVAESMRRGLIK